MERVVEFTLKAKEDIEFFRKSGQPKILKRIRQLIEATLQDPFSGIGKPEPLKYDLSGTWSRRISKEHRLVYEALDDKIFVLSARGHY